MVNKVILIGNVGVDPDIRATENGKVARLRVATTERYRDRATNENREHTEWHTVMLWRGLADIADRFVHKGSQLYIEGRLRTREWTDQAGNKRVSTEILADTMNLLGRREYNNNGENNGYNNNGNGGYNNNYRQNNYRQQQQQQTAPATAPAAAETSEDSDDLPF